MSRKTQQVQLEAGYNITITGRHVQVTDAMKEYAMEKISKIERFLNHIIDVTVTMDIQKLDHKVDVVFKFNHFKIRAQATSDNMYTSIDRVLTKIQAQMRKYKTKIQSHQAKGLAVVDMNVNVYGAQLRADLDDVNEEIDKENLRELENSLKPHDVISKETRPLKTLTTEEAIMKMELSGDSFLIFKGEENQHIRVIYRRDDEGFGIIEPQ